MRAAFIQATGGALPCRSLVSSKRLAAAPVVSCGWFQASCSSPAALGREQRARRPGATGESCRVAPPEGVLFTSGGYVALALGRILEHAVSAAANHCLGDDISLSNEGPSRLYAELYVFLHQKSRLGLLKGGDIRAVVEKLMSALTSLLTVGTAVNERQATEGAPSRPQSQGQTERVENASTLHARRGR